MKRVAFYSNKGGIGKTTLSYNIAHLLTKLNKKVLLIDTDGQNSISKALKIKLDDKKTLYELMKNECALEEVIIKDVRENLDVIANRNISEITSMLNQERRIDLTFKRLFKDLDALDYDLVLFDCNPSVDRMNDATLLFVDNIVLPVQPEVLSVDGLVNTFKYLDELGLERDMISHIIPNMCDMRVNLHREKLAEVRELFKDYENVVVTHEIKRTIKVAEACAKGKTVIEYDKETADEFLKVAKGMVNLFNE